jgi:Protein of unknown function (DUF3102)
MAEIDTSVTVTPILAEHTRAIHALLERTRQDIIEIGRHLTEARNQVAHGAWLDWIEVEFEWSDQTARRFIHVYELSLARISHTTECIGVANQRKPLCRNNSSSIRGAPRCRQSVARISLDLNLLKAARW